MNCSEVADILEVRDPARAPCPGGLRDHLKSCARCREEYPELVWLFEARDAEAAVRTPTVALPRKASRFRVRWGAAAAILLVAVWLGWQAFTSRERRPDTDRLAENPTRPAAVADRGVLSGDLGTVSYCTVTVDRGHRQESLTMADVLPDLTPASNVGERSPH